MKFSVKSALLTAVVVGLVGCATSGPLALPKPLRLPQASADNGLTLPSTQAAGTERVELGEKSTPVQPGGNAPTVAGLKQMEAIPPGLNGSPVSVNIANVPLPTFVNEVLGNLLGLTFKLDPEVEKKTDLITLRTSQPQKPIELYRIARLVLADYGIEMLASGPVVRVQLAPAGSRAEPPLVYSGRALPEVPVSHRPVFYMMDLVAIRSNEAARLLKSVYGDDVRAEEISERNALMISGRPERVRQAVDALQVFDRPNMRGRSSLRLEPAFMTAEQLASKLTEVLVAQGYGASNSLGVPASILILPVQATNSVILFAADPALLRHATAWARDLDRPNLAAGSGSVFYYPVKNTKAEEIANILGAASASSVVPVPPAPGATTPAATPAAAAVGASRALVVDLPRNALIFQGDPAQWERLLPLIKQMDREARQVMIEMTIAEVTLDDNEEFGVSWFAKGAPGRRFGGRLNFGTLPTTNPITGIAGAGLSYLLDVAGQNRALLKAFADDQRVSILSTPRLLVKSGGEASIDVGTEVPTITARQTGPQQVAGTTGLLQSIQYRKTGIILNVKPTVYSEDRVDLELDQEVSEALPIAQGDATGSPSIFNRSVRTSLSLRDGGSIVLGGLMSHRQTKADAGIPFVKNVPLVGNLFKTQSKRNNKTELVLMIVAYIVGSDQRMQDLTDAIRDGLDLIKLPERAELVPPSPVPRPTLPPTRPPVPGR